MKYKTRKDGGVIHVDRLLDGMRQWRFPPEFRIPAPSRDKHAHARAEGAGKRAPAPKAKERPTSSEDDPRINKLIAEFASCLWYLKTRYFKKEWEDGENGDDDPRVRRALGRLGKSVETLKECGVEVNDPTNKRYPPGGEGMMRPIQFIPTDGLTFEMVSETVTPIIYRDEKMIQRGEVFVAVPKEENATATKPAPEADAAHENGAPAGESPDKEADEQSEKRESGPDASGGKDN